MKIKHKTFMLIKKLFLVDAFINLTVDYAAKKCGWVYAERLDAKLNKPIVFLYKKWMGV